MSSVRARQQVCSVGHACRAASLWDRMAMGVGRAAPLSGSGAVTREGLWRHATQRQTHHRTTAASCQELALQGPLQSAMRKSWH